MHFQPATPYRKKQPVASVPPDETPICWNCGSFDIQKLGTPPSGHPDHTHRCKSCGATGAPEDFRGVESSAAIVNRRRRA